MESLCNYPKYVLWLIFAMHEYFMHSPPQTNIFRSQICDNSGNAVQHRRMHLIENKLIAIETDDEMIIL